MNRFAKLSLILMLLISCSPQVTPLPMEALATDTKVVFTNTPKPIPTFTNTAPSPTQTPAPKKSVRISYSVMPGDGVDEIMSCINAYLNYRFVLYDDGQVILFKDSSYYEAMLTKNEIEELITQITLSGFFSLAGNGDQYSQGYVTPTFQGGWGYQFKVDGKSIYFNDLNNLADPLKTSLELVLKFMPQDLHPYFPNRLILWVFPEEYLPPSIDPNNDIPKTTQQWTQNEFDLYPFAVSSISYTPPIITGDELSFIMQYTQTIPSYFVVDQMVNQEEQKYHIFVCPDFFDR